MHTDGASSVSVLIPSQSFPIYIKNFWGGGGGRSSRFEENSFHQKQIKVGQPGILANLQFCSSVRVLLDREKA